MRQRREASLTLTVTPTQSMGLYQASHHYRPLKLNPLGKL